MKNKKKHLQIQKLKKGDYFLLYSISLIIILVMGMLYVYTANAKQSRIELIQDVMVQTAENQRIQFEEYINEKVNILKVLVSYPDIYKMSPHAQEVFLENRSKELGFTHMFVVDANGLGYYFEEGVIRDQAKEDFFNDVMEHDIFITKPYYTGSGKAIMTACVSIYDENGEKKGVLCGAINLENVQRLITQNEMILDGKSYVLDEDGKYLTSQNLSDVVAKLSIYDSPNSDIALIKEAFAENADKRGSILLNGVEYESSVTYLEGYNWVILQIIPEDKITERFELLNWVQYVLSLAVFVLILCIVRIIYLWRQSDEKIYTDSLTKCNSRAACIDILDYMEAKRKEQITIVYMDLDQFKMVNDTLGHEKGDTLLKIFADVLMQTFGKIGFVGRMGGDEFIAVLQDISEEELQMVWKQVESLLITYSKTLDFEYQMSSSYGYATRLAGETTSLDKLLQIADEKMYEYKKEQKKNR